MKTDLLKDAIADADAIKKLAIENAKASLNEAFDSKIKSMLAAKLQEEAGDELEEDLDEADDDLKKMEAKMRGEEEGEEGDDEPQDESFDIDAILAEMEGEEEEKEGDKDKMNEKKKPQPEEEEGEEEDDMPSKEGDEELEETIDLDALIAEMSKEEEGEEEANEAYGSDDDDEEKKKMEESDIFEEEGVGDDSPEMEMLSKFKKFLKSQRKPAAPKAEEPQKESIELQEIKRQAAELAKKVNETNLINAKLLYLNKVLRNHNLSENQKIKVVAAFDRATSVKEAKIVYESLNEALNLKVQSGKVSLKESLGFASKASGTSTRREIITEVDSQVSRWQKLAGIKK